MRELEFLPEWYPRLRRRKRLVVLQTYMAIVLAVGLGGWLLLCGRNIRAKEASVAKLRVELLGTDLRLKKLDDLLVLRKQMQAQDHVIRELGLHVEVTRMLNAIEAAMPNEMSLLGMTFDIEESAKSAISSLARGRQSSDTPAAALDRRLRVRLTGVAPTDVDLASFLGRLGSYPFLDQIAMTYAREKSDSGHIMREFEVGFSLNLNGG